MAQRKVPAGMTVSDRLNDYIEQALLRPFDWRECNCCHFAQGWVVVERHITVPLGQFKSELHQLHGQNAVDAITERLGCPSLRAAYAQTGDIVFTRLRKPGRWMVGISAGPQVAFRMMGDGLVYLPRELCDVSWPLNMIRGSR